MQFNRSRLVAAGATACLTMLTGTAGIAAAEDPAVQQSIAQEKAKRLGLDVQHVRAQLDESDRLANVATSIERALGDDYGGAWFGNDGELSVGIPAGPEEDVARRMQTVQRIATQARVDDHVRLARVERRWDGLEAEHKSVDEQLFSEIQAGRVMTSLDPETNAVIVRVSASADIADIQARLASTGTSDRVRIVPDAANNFTLRPFTCSQRSTDLAMFCGNPFRGGVLVGTSSRNCSAGFVVLGNSGGSPWMLTAGHCLNPDGGATWSSRDNNLTLHDLGARHSWTFGSGGDYGITGFSTSWWNTSPYVVYDGASTYNETYHIYDSASSVVGMDICATGGQYLPNGHYTDCGTVTSVGNTVSVDGTVVGGLGHSNACVGLGGNSGGPFYKNGHAYGLLSSGSSVCDAYYQGTNGALSGSNVHLPG